MRIEEKNSSPVQKKVSKIFIRLSGYEGQKDHSRLPRSTLCSLQNKVTKDFTLTKPSRNYTESQIKQPQGQYGQYHQRVTVTIEHVAESSKMRRLVGQGFLLIMSTCRVKYAETFQTENWHFANGSVLYSSLYICLHRVGMIFSEMNKFLMLRRIYHALKYIHENNVIHGNISSHAIQVMDTNTVKLGNFEYMRVKGTRETKWPAVDFWRWMSPETLQKKQSVLESDIFSFCSVCLEYFSNCLPWAKRSRLFVENHYTKGNIFPMDTVSAPKEIKECFSDSLAIKKHQRRFNFHYFESIMISRSKNMSKHNLKNFSVRSKTEMVCSNQTGESNVQQLTPLRTSTKRINLSFSRTTEFEKSENCKSFDRTESEFKDIRMTTATSDSVRFLIKYFEDRFSPYKSVFNSRRVHRRTSSSRRYSAIKNSPENKVSKARLFLRTPEPMRCNSVGKKSSLQDLYFQDTQLSGSTSSVCGNLKSCNSDVKIRTKRMIFERFRQQGFESKKLSNKSLAEKSQCLDHLVTNNEFVSVPAERNLESNLLGNDIRIDESSRRQSYPVYSSTSKMLYLKPSEDCRRKLNIKFSDSSVKTSSVVKLNTIQRKHPFKDYVKCQVNKWEKPMRERLVKSERRYYSKYIADFHLKASS
ncbi:uncharacterized protein LOC115218991 [Argonauta hians]